MYGQVVKHYGCSQPQRRQRNFLKFELSVFLLPLCRVMSNAIMLIQEVAGSSEVLHLPYMRTRLQWNITPCLTDSSNAHGATSKFLDPKPFYRSTQQQFRLLRAIFVIIFGRGTGTIISVLHFRLA